MKWSEWSMFSMKPDDRINIRHMADALTSVGRFVSERRRISSIGG